MKPEETNGQDAAQNRRRFLRDSALVALGGVAGGAGFAKEALAASKNVRINTEAKAVMPDGRVRTRTELMRQLGLNPGTAPDAWLNIVGCGSNASALTSRQRQNLMKRGLKFEGLELKGISKDAMPRKGAMPRINR